jgi:hypothetical protein
MDDGMIGGNLVAPPRRIAPLWLMGLTNSVFGMYGGIIVIAIPQLLSIRHVPETTIAAMISAYNIPITYMLFIDGWGYGKQGVAGSFVADASLGVVASVLLGILLIWVTRRHSSASAAPPAPMALGTNGNRT